MYFPIVGIGASAGGLESFSELIAGIPAHTGMAYVFVRHLNPRVGSVLVSILSKGATFPVEEVSKDMKVLPDHLYVIAPNTTLTINDDVLHLSSRDPAERPHHPVDTLLHSLAEQRGPNGIGIVLSGCGSDGAKGIHAIKQAGGITFAQDENSALFFGMPNTAIQTGCVDFVLAPRMIAQELIRISLNADRKGLEKAYSERKRCEDKERLETNVEKSRGWRSNAVREGGVGASVQK